MGTAGARPTITDVAARAGLSIKTVSRVLNKEPHVSERTLARVLEAIRALDYRPNYVARSLVTKRTQTVGLIIPDVCDPFWPEVIRGVEARAADAGYVHLLCNTDEDPRREQAFFSLLLEKQVDGIILCSSRAPEADLLAFAKNETRLVLVNRDLPGRNVSSVRVDNEAGSYEAAGHLVTHGYRRIAMIAGPPEMHSTHERVQGFCRALEEAGLSLAAVAHTPASTAGWTRMETARRMSETLLQPASRPEAVFAHDDLVALGVLAACRSLGLRVPEDVAVVGYDDIPEAALPTPRLTTVATPKRQLGEEAMSLLLRLLESGESANVVVRPCLVVRESCGCKTGALVSNSAS